MMGYGGCGLAGGSVGIITWFVVMIDLILVGMWLWQQVTKK
jgi:hypothetical protein